MILPLFFVILGEGLWFANDFASFHRNSEPTNFCLVKPMESALFTQKAAFECDHTVSIYLAVHKMCFFQSHLLELYGSFRPCCSNFAMMKVAV